MPERVVRLYKNYQLSNSLLVWLPIFYLYQRESGLSDGQIFGIQAIYYVAFCLLDVPTGMIADRYDYRRFLQAGAALLTLANLVPVFFPSYWGFLTHFMIIALAYSFTSGAGSAYVYEYLHRSGADHAYRQAEGSARAYALIGRVVCLPAAGVLMQWEPTAPYWLSAVATTAAFVVALRFPKLPPGTVHHENASVAQAWNVLRRAPLLALIMVQGVAIFTLARILQANLFQPVLDAKHLPVAWFGVLMAATQLFEAAGAARPGLLRRRVSDLGAVFGLTVIMAVCLAFIVPAGIAGTIACLCVFSLATGLSFPVQRQLMNDAISDPRTRATLLSAESLIDRAVCSGAIFVLGSYLSAGAMNTFLVHAAITTVVLMIAIAVLIKWVRLRQGDHLRRHREASSEPDQQR
ncbi:MFS transporter [Lentzea sp. NBRC 105346]|uniref:MFS transporter n=1 Tax=Lentzea sp. NBRC 105346 TaxID=3032205 RepID=UPI0024A13F2D|nr:MFS transporter [Lentzea sp. NBRC 105346]GLZ28590.1 MFS transporter [Lentzea sp. NBRC 105346]